MIKKIFKKIFIQRIATTTLLISVLCAATTSAFTILNPWTGRVEFSLAESASEDNRVAASATNPEVYPASERRAGSSDDEHLRANVPPEEKQQVKFDTREEYSEYLTPDGTPKYKVIKYSPYGHTSG